MLGATGKTVKFKTLLVPPGVEHHGGAAFHLKRKLRVDLVRRHEEHGHGCSVDCEARFAQGRRNRNFAGRDIDGAELAAPNRYEPSCRNCRSEIGGTDDLRELRRRHGGVIVPGDRRETRNRQRHESVTIRKRCQRPRKGKRMEKCLRLCWTAWMAPARRAGTPWAYGERAWGRWETADTCFPVSP